MNYYQNEGKAKVWKKKGSAYDPRDTSSSVKHGGGHALACAAASEMGSIFFIDCGWLLVYVCHTYQLTGD